MASKEILGFSVDFLKQVKTLFVETNIEEVEIEQGEGLYLRVSRKKETPQVAYAPMPAAPMMAAPAVPMTGGIPAIPSGTPEKPTAKAEGGAFDDEKKYQKIKSPIVGTYYESPAPGSPAFVKVGDMVSPDTSVCIVEAMKVMNEIKADCKGKVVQIAKTSGASVIANDVLMVVEKM